MSHKFKKNHCIYDSESDEEHDSTNSETEDSLSSINDSDPEYEPQLRPTSSVSEVKSHRSKKPVCKENDLSVSLPENDASFTSPSIKKDTEYMFKKEEIVTDHNSNNFSKAAQHKIQKESTGDFGSISVSDSSVSVVNETQSVISESYNESCDELRKSTYGKADAAKSRIIEESSDSSSDSSSHSSPDCSLNSTPDLPPDSSLDSPPDLSPDTSSGSSSVESVDSFTTTNPQGSCNATASPKVKHVVNSSVEIEVIQDLSLKNLSKISNSSNSYLSKSGLSNGSQSSIHSNSSYDEHKLLECQLADKRTAYQNILRAVKTCDPKKLKDGGKLLQEKLARCKEEVDELKEKLKNVADLTGDSPNEKHSTKPNALFSTSDQVTINLGKKGLETHRVQAALTVDALVTLHGSLQTCPAEGETETDPKGLRSELMPHQKYALAWLLWREKQIPAGGILADDMGLGKTLTMIALVLRAEEYKRQNNIEDDEAPVVENGVKMYPGKTLVVCPSSLLGQWQGQIKQHCKPHLLGTLIHHGKPRELQAKKLAACDIVITSYGVCVEENKLVNGNKKGPLFRVKWDRVIIDEGHVIRNHKTKTAQALCELEAKHRWCLTGTPVQNKELDMYSLLKFLRCSPFDSLPVWKRWVDNKSANGIQRLNTVVKSILLRRTKEELKNLGELQELPSKTSVPVYINLDEEEQKVYHTLLHFSKNLLTEFLLQEQKKHGFGSDEISSKHRELIRSVNEIKTTEIFVLLLRLRQICCLPGLIHSMLEKDSCAEDGIDPADDPVLESLTSQMKRMSVGAPTIAEDFKNKGKILVDSNPVFQINRPSRKIRTVLDIIKEALDSDDKIVIVSQWTSLLQKLKTHIVPLNIGVVTLDGTVPVKLRPSIIEDFNNKDNNVKVMLLSLTAGGVGLNLTGGNRLVIFEPHWNPQLESQACDRIYRVGQKKRVYIYKIICKGTIEEKIEALQKKKLEIAKAVLKGELKVNMSKLTLADLKILFDIR